jgi:hypothetical protein
MEAVFALFSANRAFCLWNVAAAAKSFSRTSHRDW